MFKMITKKSYKEWRRVIMSLKKLIIQMKVFVLKMISSLN